MLHEVDEALHSLITAGALAGSGVEMVFDAPTREWAARRNTPTVNTYLYDIREEVGRRERGPLRTYGDDGRVTGRHQPPRFYRLSYLLTVWTKQPQDEHRLLAAVLACLVRHETLPAGLLPPGGILAATGLAVPLTVGVPPTESRSIADIWSALGGQLKPSLDVVVVAPLPVSPEYAVGPPVETLEVRVRDTVGRVEGARRVETAETVDAIGAATGELRRMRRTPR
jgi:Pvc16 N-terminal domain